jgi:hypothetical protein
MILNGGFKVFSGSKTWCLLKEHVGVQQCTRDLIKKNKKKEKKNSLQQPTRVPRVLGTGSVKGGYYSTVPYRTVQKQKNGEVFEDSRHPYPQNSKLTENNGATQLDEDEHD